MLSPDFLYTLLEDDAIMGQQNKKLRLTGEGSVHIAGP